MSRIAIVLPAYNAEKTLEATVLSIPISLDAVLILADDASKDGTLKIAEKLGIKACRHDKNRGYGANQKTCYAEALKTDADIIVMIHPDYQYDARLIPALILPIELGVCDAMLGNRIRSRAEALGGGMPVYKYIANRALTVMENFLLGQNLGEFHSGMRAYSRKVLEKLPWRENADGFVFDQEFLIQLTFFKFRIGDIPVPAKYFKEASSIGFFPSVLYGLLTLVTLVKYFAARLGLKSGIFRTGAP
jgi:glycosyltransferase involved in cell wall biosynthesis